MKTETDPFKRLPDPLGSLICQMCSANHPAMRFVSRLWRDKTSKAITHLNPIGFIDAKVGLVFPNVEHLQLSAQILNINSPSQIKGAIASLPELKSITLSNAGSMDGEKLRLFILNSRSINLSIHFELGGDEKIFALASAANITSIRCPPEISDEGLSRLSQNKNLRSICARGHWDRICGSTLPHLQVLPNLVELQLAHSHIVGRSLHHLTSFLQLHHLDLSFCENIQSGEFKPLGLLKTLITLNVSGTAVADVDLRAWYQLHDLLCLNLRLCSNITHIGLKSLARFKGLKELRVGQNDQI